MISEFQVEVSFHRCTAASQVRVSQRLLDQLQLIPFLFHHPLYTYNCPGAFTLQDKSPQWNWHSYRGHQQVPAQAKLSEGLLHLILSFFHPQCDSWKPSFFSFHPEWFLSLTAFLACYSEHRRKCSVWHYQISMKRKDLWFGGVL